MNTVYCLSSLATTSLDEIAEVNMNFKKSSTLDAFSYLSSMERIKDGFSYMLQKTEATLKGLSRKQKKRVIVL